MMELREYIRLTLTQGATIDLETIQAVGKVPSRAAVAGAFIVAVERRFPEQPSHAEIAAVVSRIRDRYVERDKLPPMLGESLVRIALGEDGLAQGMSNDELIGGQLMMTYGLVHDLGLAGPSFEEFLTEATQAAQEIIAAENQPS